MSAIFQRPLCEMGAAYDFALRPLVGDPELGSGGPCDDRPRSVTLLGASAEAGSAGLPRRSFLLCPEHEAQLRRHDGRLAARGLPSRFGSGTIPAPDPPRSSG